MKGNNILKKNQTFVFIFIQKITLKNLQDLIFFLQKNDFSFKRINKKNKNTPWNSIFLNSNFMLESNQKLQERQLKQLIIFLKQHTQINGIFLNNQILTFQRMEKLEKNFFFYLWKKINNWSI